MNKRSNLFATILPIYFCMVAATAQDVTGPFGAAAFSDSGQVALATAEGIPYGGLAFDGPATKAETMPASHPTLGEGQALVVTLASGDTVSLIALPDSPFLLVQRSITNREAATRDFNQIRPFNITLAPSLDPADLKALGSAGLTSVDGHAGSHGFLALANPKTRSGVVSGWVSQDRGSGILFSGIDDGRATVEPLLEYGRLRLDTGTSEDSELFAIGHFDDARLGLEAYADLVARHYEIKLPPILDGYCTWYSKKHGGACDEVHLAELAEAAAETLKPYGFDFVQIDDKWQEGQRREGPAKNFYTHSTTGPYPNGMKAAADHIKSLGLIPGIWFMPFAADRQDPYFQTHSDWLVKNPDGTPYWTSWGGTSMDMTHPGARAYLRETAGRIAQDWGYTYFKMDGLWTGTATAQIYINNEYKPDDIGQAVFHNPYKTPIEAYRDGLKLVRGAAGSDVYFLGCNVAQNMRTMAASYGLLDGMRIGPDNAAARSWNQLLRGPWHGSNRYFLHGRVWHNDPDPIGLHPDIPTEQARLICSWVGLSGQLNVFSEWLPELPEERVHLWQRTLPNHGLLPRPVDLFDSDIPRVWLLSDKQAKRHVVGLYNWSDEESSEIDISLERLGVDPARDYAAYDFWDDTLLPTVEGKLLATLAPGSCKILSLRPAVDHPQVISSSRHITQGIVDVAEESWDPATKILSGTSAPLGDKDYELRVLLPADAVGAISATSSGNAANIRRDGNLLRINLKSDGTQSIKWEVQF